MPKIIFIIGISQEQVPWIFNYIIQKMISHMRVSQSSRVRGWTNNILTEKQKDKTTYFVPCFLRLKVKNIVDLSLTSMQATLNADLIFTIYYGSLKPEHVELLKSNIVLQFNRDDSILVTKDQQITYSQNPKESILNFTIRKTLNTKIEANLFLSPFQLIKLVLVVTLRSIVSDVGGTTISIHFNLMDNDNSWMTISYTNQRAYGDYMISPANTYANYSNTLQDDPFPTQYDQFGLIEIQSQKTSTNDDLNEIVSCNHEKIKYFQYAHFYIGMYKFPFVALATIFFPMWCMGLYNIFMFFEGNDLSMRISNGSLLNLSLFAYIPTIRSQIPDTPQIMLVQILLYVIAITFTLNLIQSYTISSEDPTTYNFSYAEDPFFIISVACLIFTFVVVAVLLCIHKFHWEKKYLQQQPAILQKFIRNKWHNINCDEYFRSYDCIRMIK